MMSIDDVMDEIGTKLDQAELDGDEEMAQFLDRILTAMLLDRPRCKMWRELPDVLSVPVIDVSYSMRPTLQDEINTDAGLTHSSEFRRSLPGLSSDK